MISNWKGQYIRQFTFNFGDIQGKNIAVVDLLFEEFDWIFLSAIFYLDHWAHIGHLWSPQFHKASFDTFAGYFEWVHFVPDLEMVKLKVKGTFRHIAETIFVEGILIINLLFNQLHQVIEILISLSEAQLHLTHLNDE